jgi:hypothetical protein
VVVRGIYALLAFDRRRSAIIHDAENMSIEARGPRDLITALSGWAQSWAFPGWWSGNVGGSGPGARPRPAPKARDLWVSALSPMPRNMMYVSKCIYYKSLEQPLKACHKTGIGFAQCV